VKQIEDRVVLEFCRICNCAMPFTEVFTLEGPVCRCIECGLGLRKYRTSTVYVMSYGDVFVYCEKEVGK
jgi:hypothetical protein